MAARGRLTRAIPARGARCFRRAAGNNGRAARSTRLRCLRSAAGHALLASVLRFVCQLFVFALAATRAGAAVVINEIHYHPNDKTSPSEFIELFNTGPA